MKPPLLFEDLELLFRLDADLRKGAIERGIPLLEWPPQEPGQKHPREYRSRLTVISQSRKQAIESISFLQRTPASWQELAERMWADRWLEEHLQNQAKLNGARDKPSCSAIVLDVRTKLYFLIISNAGKWAEQMSPGGNWRGWVIRQIRGLAKRCALKVLPPKREQPYGGEHAQHGNWFDRQEQNRELPPDSGLGSSPEGF